MSSRGRNPSRPSNTGFKVVPAHAPHSAYLGKAKKLKESLIERARIKKSFAKALKKEGLQSERLGRGQDSGLGQGYDGNGPARGSSLNSRGRGSGRAGGNVGGRPGGGRGGSRSSVIKQDGVRELVQLSRKTKPNADSSTPNTAAGSKATNPPGKRTVVPESESDESELESGEERAPRPSKTQSRITATNADDDEEDDGFFDDDDVEGDMIDSRVSLRRNKGKGKGRADRVDQDGAMSMSEDEDEGNNVKRSRERSRAGPPPDDDDDQDEDDEEVFLPYTNSTSTPSLRGRGGSTRGASTSTSSRGRNHLQGSKEGARPTSSSSTSTPVYGAGRPRPWGTDGVAFMSHPGSGSMGTMTRPKGKKDKANPNFTFLGRMGDDAGNADRGERDARAGGRTGTKDRMEQEVPPKAVVVNNTPFRGKPLHSHKPPGSTPSPADPNSTTTTTTDNNNNNSRSTLTLRDLKRTAYLGPAKTCSAAVGAGVHPGRTIRTLQKQQQQQHAQAQQQQGGRVGVVGGRRNASGGTRQPRLGARMGALLQEIERRG